MSHAMKTTTTPPSSLPTTPPHAVTRPTPRALSRRIPSQTSSRGPDSPGVASSGSGEKHALHQANLDQGIWRPNVDEEKHAIRYYSTGESGTNDFATSRNSGNDMRRNTFWALMYLASLAPLLSFVITLGSALLMLFVFFSTPLQLCIRSMQNFESRTVNILYPLLALHHRGVSSVPFGSRDSSSTLESPYSQNERTGTVWRMVLVLLLSPIVAMPFMIASWVVGCFWTLSALVALDGSQPPEMAPQRDNDGIMSAQALVRWWISWLDGCR